MEPKTDDEVVDMDKNEEILDEEIEEEPDEEPDSELVEEEVQNIAGMVKLADTQDLKSCILKGCKGSIPFPGMKFISRIGKIFSIRYERPSYTSQFRLEIKGPGKAIKFY